MMLYTMLCFYSCFNDKPVRAAIFMSLGLSVKAGALLYVPAFLGWIQYKYGLIKLGMVATIIAVIQVSVALPFVWDPAAYALGFKMGAKTTIMEYLEFSRLAKHLLNHRQMASSHKNTYYWSFLDKEYFE
jgi:Gpi18-like mannosyltransferase